MIIPFGYYKGETCILEYNQEGIFLYSERSIPEKWLFNPSKVSSEKEFFLFREELTCSKDFGDDFDSSFMAIQYSLNLNVSQISEEEFKTSIVRYILEEHL